MMREYFINNLVAFFSMWGVIAIKLALLLAGGLILIKLTLKITNKVLAKNQIEKSARRFFYNLIKFALYTVLAILMLGATGISATSFIIILALVATTTAVAFMKSLVNLASGLTIITTKQIRENEEIEVNNIKGVVSEIKLTHTIITTKDGNEVVVPNKLFLEKPTTKNTGQPKNVFSQQVRSANENKNKKNKQNKNNQKKYGNEKLNENKPKNEQTYNQNNKTENEPKQTKTYRVNSELNERDDAVEELSEELLTEKKEYLDYNDEIEVIEEIEIINNELKNESVLNETDNQPKQNKNNTTVKMFNSQPEEKKGEENDFINNYESAKQGIKKSKFGFIKTKKAKNKKPSVVIKK